jgi:hypothetical protein
MIQRVFSVLAVVLLYFSLPFLPAKTYSAERFDQAITIQHDGSLLVEETVVFKFTGGPFTYVYRNLPTDKTDGISIVSATMDERAMPRGTGAGQVEIVGGNPIKVTWHFTPLSDQAHTFVLTYRVLGVVQKARDADMLNWEILPTDYDYAIRSSTTTVRYPEQAVFLGPPQVTNGTAQVATTAGKIIFSAHDISAGSRLQIALRFRPGSVITVAPHWQLLQEQAITLIPPYLGGGLALFLLCLLIALWHYRRYRRPSLLPEEPSQGFTSPPDELPPAVVGVLVAPMNTMYWNSALATIFDLASREVLAILQSPEPKKWYRIHPDFLIEQRSQPPDLRPYELGLLSVLFQDRAGMRTSITMPHFSRTYANRYQRFTKPLRQEMVERGLIDVERRRVRMWLLSISVSVAIVAFTTTIIAASIAGPAGMWPIMFLPLGVGLASSVMGVLWALFSPLSAQGWREAKKWRAYSRSLNDVARGRTPVPSPETFGQSLVYATSIGFVEKWVKFFQRQGMVEVPPWFHSLATARAEAMAYFVMMIAVSHSVSTSSGAAGGGAAGGGASGAG